MITEKDRIVASIVAISDGPLPHQIKQGGWTPDMLAFSRSVLLALAKSIRNEHHMLLSDSEVRRILAEWQGH